jgi:Transposase domain (DUF772)
MRRELGQLSLADGLVEGAGRNRQLAKIAALVDWTVFERLLGAIYAAPAGRPSYGPVVLLKCLLLQQWYRLSDPGSRRRSMTACHFGASSASRWPIRCRITRPCRAFAAS